MWQAIIIQLNGWKLEQGEEPNVRFSYIASTESTLTVFAFLYNEKGELVETFIPSLRKPKS